MPDPTDTRERRTDVAMIPRRWGQTGLLKYGFVGPALLLLISLNIFPLIYTIVLSFTNAELSGGDSSWVGVSAPSHSVTLTRVSTSGNSMSTWK